MAVREGWRGRFFEDFEVGDVYEHPLGRTAAVGVVFGARIAHAVPATVLRRVVATALLCAGLLIAVQTVW
jgi:uncharacterized membrane protein YfcA